jgi:GNAT superfamily N-acetyltransferase
VNLSADRRQESDTVYEFKAGPLSEYTPEEVKKCLALIGDGGAVNLRTMKRDLPRSQMVVIACWQGELVGVGAIKPVREEYAAGIAAKSGYAFPPDTSELRYVVVEPAHRGHGLSRAITELLLKRHSDPLFATTDSPKMKKTLASAGFRQEGQEWQGDRGILSFWERKQS